MDPYRAYLLICYALVIAAILLIAAGALVPL